MLTNFSVQASINDFFTAQRIFRDPATKALPQVGHRRPYERLQRHRLPECILGTSLLRIRSDQLAAIQGVS